MLRTPSTNNLGKENTNRSAEKFVDPMDQKLLDNLTAAGFLINPAPPAVYQPSPLHLPEIKEKKDGIKITPKPSSPDWGHWVYTDDVKPPTVKPANTMNRIPHQRSRYPWFLPAIQEAPPANKTPIETKSAMNTADLLVSI